MDRWIVVDNTHNGFQYSGAWTSVSGAPYDPHGNFGRTYLTTLQSLSSGQGTISYTFRGTSGRVYGTNNIQESNGRIDPTWECAVDGKAVSMPNSFPYAENNWILCEWSGVSDGTHTLTITARSNGRAFLFDYFIYTPSTNQIIQNTVVGASWRDSSVQYGAGWDGWGGSGYQGKDAGAIMKFPFYGTGITFTGLTPVEGAAGEAQAEYFIDDQSPTQFAVPGRSSETQFHRVFFRTGSVSLGHHTLTVIYQGRDGLMPLVLGSFLIESSTFPPPARNTNNNGGGNGNTGAGSSIDPPSGTSSPSTGNNNGTFGGLPDQNSSRPTSAGGIVVVTATGADGSVRTTSVRSPSNNTGIGAPTDATGQLPATATGTSGSWGVGGDSTIFVGGGTDKSKTPIGAIIGGVLGAMALAGFFILAVMKHRASMKRKKNQNIPSENGHFQPFDTLPRNRQAPVDSQSMNEQTVDPFYPEFYPNRKGAVVAAGGYVIRNPGTSLHRLGAVQYNVAYSDTPSSEALRPQSRMQLPPSKHEEAQREVQESADRIVIHSDSGYRVPIPAVPISNTQTAEYPPLYTAS